MTCQERQQCHAPAAYELILQYLCGYSCHGNPISGTRKEVSFRLFFFFFFLILGTATQGYQTVSSSAIVPVPATSADYHTPVKQHFNNPSCCQNDQHQESLCQVRQQAALTFVFGKKLISKFCFVPALFWVLSGEERSFVVMESCVVFPLLYLFTMWSGLLCHIVFAFWSTELPMETTIMGRASSASLFSL